MGAVILELTNLSTVVIGVRHRNAPISIREQLVFSDDELPDALRDLLTYPGITEAVILSTCNRTEIYATVYDTELGIRSLKSFLADYKRFDYNKHMAYAFMLLHEDADMHLFRVSSGLDSLILGEGQILSQVKQALKIAMGANTSGESLSRLFKTALSVGKAVRTETGIALRDVNIPKAAFEFLKTHHPSFLEGSIAVIGAGKMADIMLEQLNQARPFVSRPDNDVVLVNRSVERLEELSQHYDVPGLGWDQIQDVIKTYDTLLVATSSPHVILKPEWFDGITATKLIMDISVPRNVAPCVAENTAIKLFNTDDLGENQGFSEDSRVRISQQANSIIEREYRKFYQWRVSRNAVPLITQLRDHIESIRQSEVDDIAAYCPDTMKRCSVIDNLSKSLVNKILHDPTVRLKETAQLNEILHLAQLINSLFNMPAEEGSCSGRDALHTAAAPHETLIQSTTAPAMEPLSKKNMVLAASDNVVSLPVKQQLS